MINNSIEELAALIRAGAAKAEGALKETGIMLDGAPVPRRRDRDRPIWR